MVSPKWLSMLTASAIALATVTTDFAQAQVVPNDVSNPASDAGIPALLTGANSVIRPQDLAVLQFDSLLDPSNGADPARLSAAAQSIVINHQVAQQQVELAILYLRSNEAEIIAGKNVPFNSIYGRNTVRQKVAILAPVPLPGGFNLASPSLLQARPQTGGNAQAPRISVGTLLRAGDFLYMPDPTSNVGANNNQVATNNFTRTQYPNLSTNPGYVVKIAAVIKGGINAQGGGGGNNQNQNQNTDFVLDPNFGNVQTGQRALNNLTAWRVVRFEERDDPTIYYQVLATYMAIREALAGYDPSQLSRGIQTQNRIQYSRTFQSIGPQISATGVRTAGFYANGQADYTALDALVATNLGITGRGADRLVRQAGLSLSDSHYHLDRLEDLGNSTIVADRKGQPVTPLLWTEDNDMPLTFNSRVQVAGATNEDRAYFRDRQTIFGDYLNNPNYTGDGIYNQFIGRAFLEELLLHAGGFADTGVASTTPLLRGIRQRRNPAGGTLQFTGGGGNTPQVPDLELGDRPESGTPTQGKTLKKWQMILSSFGEWSDGATRSTSPSNPSIFNSAFLGLLDLNGGTGLPSLRASDANSYSLFADLLNSSNSGGISFNRIEPIGKRGNAGFNPVVPSN